MNKSCADLTFDESIEQKLSDGSKATNQSEVGEWTWMTLASAPFAMSLTGFVDVRGWKSDNVPIPCARLLASNVRSQTDEGKAGKVSVSESAGSVMVFLSFSLPLALAIVRDE